MKAVFTLTPAESKKLIAKAVAVMDEVQQALKEAYVIIGGGTTNAFIARELTGKKEIESQRFTAGISTMGILCVTPPDERNVGFPIVLYKGQVVEKTFKEAFEDFHKETVFIKGANAIDPEGNVGVITSGFDGGTVAASIGTMTSTGMKYIFPVGLEKLVPSVREAAKYVGAKTFDYSMGANFGMYCLSNGIVVTEIQALKILADVEAKHIASGGIGGSEGAVVLVTIGEEKNIKKAISVVESIKGEPPVKGLKGLCEPCLYDCVFRGMKEEDLPAWLNT